MTLIELLVALSVAVFLLAALMTIVQNTRRAFGTQTQMSQLQDNERLAMTLMGDVIQEAGYYPNPTLYTAAGALPVTGSFATAGQAVFGTTADTVSARFMTAPGDGMINCTGGTNTTAATVTYTNTFSVDVNGNLNCALNNGAATTTQTLVSGVTNLSILYGVKTDFTANNGAVDSYLTAAQMTAANWMHVISVRITLTFKNPLAGQPNQPATIPFQRVVAVMSQTGVIS
jgi:type IV pilus assembly protein PilW